MSDTTPYGTWALEYLESGLGYPIPSQYPFEKFPPLTGWTGRDGAIPDEHRVLKWMDSHADSNILIRMSPHVIGLDVDDYDDKHGIATIQKLQFEHGKLPGTASSTARTEPSGIHWYRLASWMDTDKMRDPGLHVEVIRYEHRYAVAPPSWHPGAHARYRWTDAWIPKVDSLCILPIEWYVHLNRGCDCFELERAQKRATIQKLLNRPSGTAGREAARRDLDDAAETLSVTAIGSRNNVLSVIAGRFMLYDVVFNAALEADEVIDVLTTAADEAGLESHETQRTLLSALDWAIREGANNK